MTPPNWPRHRLETYTYMVRMGSQRRHVPRASDTERYQFQPSGQHTFLMPSLKAMAST